MAIRMNNQKESESQKYSSDNNENSSPSYIGEGVKIKGNIVTEKALVLRGKLKGNIHSNGLVTIEQGGDVKGNINAKTLNVFGKTEGDIKTGDKLCVYPSGNICGNINSINIVIKEGGRFSGTANIDKKDKAVK